MKKKSPPAPPPPGLHWTLVLLLGIVTVSLFLDVWIVVQCVWAKKFDPKSRALALCIAGIVATLLALFLSWLKADTMILLPLEIGSLVLDVVASFSVRDTLGEYITRVEGRPTYLSGVMTIFFGPIYLQYHMDRIRALVRRTAASGVQ